MTTNVTSDDYVPWRALLGSGHVGALLLVCLAVWLHAADSLVVATMLPVIVDDIGGAALVSWTLSLYEIGSITAGAGAALLTMRHGLRLPMTVAALVFGTGCAISAISPTMELLLAGRVFQGLGGGGLTAMCFVAVGQLFPRYLVARVLAAVSMFWGMSAFLGPLIGGFFVEYFSWRWGFGFFAIQAAVLALWIYGFAPKEADQTTAAQRGGFPAARLGLLSLSIVLVSLAGAQIGPWRTPFFLVAGLICLVLFLRRDSHAQAATRLLPLSPVDPRHATGATLLMIFLFAMGTIAISAYGPILITIIHGTSAITAGYVVASAAIGWTIAAVLVSGAPERFDRHLIALGMGLVFLSVPGFLYAVPHGPVWLIAAAAAIEGGGFGMAWTFILRRATALAPEDEIQRLSGAMPTVQRTGYAMGAAYIGIIANASGFLTMQTVQDAADVAWVLFAACLPLVAAGVLAMVGLVRRHPQDVI